MFNGPGWGTKPDSCLRGPMQDAVLLTDRGMESKPTQSDIFYISATADQIVFKYDVWCKDSPANLFLSHRYWCLTCSSSAVESAHCQVPTNSTPTQAMSSIELDFGSDFISGSNSDLSAFICKLQTRGDILYSLEVAVAPSMLNSASPMQLKP